MFTRFVTDKRSPMSLRSRRKPSHRRAGEQANYLHTLVLHDALPRLNSCVLQIWQYRLTSTMMRAICELHLIKELE